MNNSVWVLTSEFNDYDQHGEYFLEVYGAKPTDEQLAVHVHNALERQHLLEKGGGRMSIRDDQWFYLQEHKV